MAGSTGRFVWKMTTSLLAIPVGRSIAKAVDSAWMTVRPQNPPTDPKNTATKAGDALGFAAMSAVATAATSLLATRGADTIWRAITGTPPPPPKQRKQSRKERRHRETSADV